MPTLDVICQGIDVLRFYVQCGQPVPPNLLIERGQSGQTLLHCRTLGNLVLYNYSSEAARIPGALWKPALIVARGIVFHYPSGQLVSFPYTKFFNVDETPETRLEKLLAWPVASITEKMDGVFVQAFQYNRETIWASRHGFFTPPSLLAQKIAGNIRIPPQTTMMFEVISQQFRQPTMIDYGKDGLWFLGWRDLTDFRIVQAIPPDSVVLPHSVSIVQVHAYERLEDFLLYIKRREATKEGVVVQGASERGNLLAKVKGEAYVQRVRFIMGMTPRKVLGAYKQSGIDGLREIDPAVLDDRAIRNVVHLIIDTEQKTREEVMRVQREGIRPQEIPDPNKRWMASNNPEKYIRTYVARIVEAALAKT